MAGGRNHPQGFEVLNNRTKSELVFSGLNNMQEYEYWYHHHYDCCYYYDYYCYQCSSKYHHCYDDDYNHANNHHYHYDDDYYCYHHYTMNNRLPFRFSGSRQKTSQVLHCSTSARCFHKRSSKASCRAKVPRPETIWKFQIQGSVYGQVEVHEVDGTGIPSRTSPGATDRQTDRQPASQPDRQTDRHI